MPWPDARTQVLVVGAGPVGLLVAGDLRRDGVGVVLADTLAAPMAESRASQLNARSMEILDQRGLVRRLGDLSHEVTGHFGGLPLDVGGTASRYAGHWKLPQYRTETALRDRAVDAGAELLREHELRELTVTDGGVEARFRTPTGRHTIHADHVVGCDGAASSVRALAGFVLAGAPAARQLLRADVDGVDVPDRRLVRFERGLAAASRRSDGVTRVMVHEYDGPAAHHPGPPSFAQVAQAWARVTGECIAGGTALWLDAFDDARAQATEYRRGRVLLAGDAAHVHMPVGGQALNLGLQDGANLAWKLAARTHGWAPPGLLDSYHRERHPVGARVLDNVAAQGLLMLGGRETLPMREVLGALLAGPQARDELAGTVSGLDVRYDVGVDGPAPLGERMPEVELTSGGEPVGTATRLLREGRGVLLDLTGDPAGRLRATAHGWSDRVRVVDVTCTAGLDGATAYLVRPDGHVVWTNAASDPLDHALERWFGTTDRHPPWRKT